MTLTSAAACAAEPRHLANAMLRVRADTDSLLLPTVPRKPRTPQTPSAPSQQCPAEAAGGGKCGIRLLPLSPKQRSWTFEEKPATPAVPRPAPPPGTDVCSRDTSQDCSEPVSPMDALMQNRQRRRSCPSIFSQTPAASELELPPTALSDIVASSWSPKKRPVDRGKFSTGDSLSPKPHEGSKFGGTGEAWSPKMPRQPLQQAPMSRQQRLAQTATSTWRSRGGESSSSPERPRTKSAGTSGVSSKDPPAVSRTHVGLDSDSDGSSSLSESGDEGKDRMAIVDLSEDSGATPHEPLDAALQRAQQALRDAMLLVQQGATLPGPTAQQLLEAEEMQKAVKKHGLTDKRALAYCLIYKLGSLDRAFHYLDCSRSSTFAKVIWQTGLLILHIDILQLTGMSTHKSFTGLSNGASIVARNCWDHFFEGIEATLPPMPGMDSELQAARRRSFSGAIMPQSLRDDTGRVSDASTSAHCSTREDPAQFGRSKKQPMLSADAPAIFIRSPAESSAAERQRAAPPGDSTAQSAEFMLRRAAYAKVAASEDELLRSSTPATGSGKDERKELVEARDRPRRSPSPSPRGSANAGRRFSSGFAQDATALTPAPPKHPPRANGISPNRREMYRRRSSEPAVGSDAADMASIQAPAEQEDIPQKLRCLQPDTEFMIQGVSRAERSSHQELIKQLGYWSSAVGQGILTVNEGPQAKEMRSQLKALQPGVSASVRCPQNLMMFTQSLAESLQISLLSRKASTKDSAGSEEEIVLEVVNDHGTVEELSEGVKQQLTGLADGQVQTYSASASANYRAAIVKASKQMGLEVLVSSRKNQPIQVGNMQLFSEKVDDILQSLQEGEERDFGEGLNDLQKSVVRRKSVDMCFECKEKGRSISVKRPEDMFRCFSNKDSALDDLRQMTEKVFNRYAQGRLGRQIFFRRIDVSGLVRDSLVEDEALIAALGEVFDDTLQLQLDVTGGAHGLSKEYFQVFLTKAGKEVSWRPSAEVLEALEEQAQAKMSAQERKA
eukprot:gb/GFBE01078925.1/.p1 GENE.gb/GFBE01078925.1/~~gb/GFBE01078925.1/.p1  ORF type:complete len:1010 (+),score=211.03 gb/GFBE01078925.1/:1-3030(+)